MTACFLPAEHFERRQAMHFAIVFIGPLTILILLPFLVEAAWLSWVNFFIWLAMWFIVGCLGVSVGLHRHFSHCSFNAARPLRFVLGFCGLMAAQGPLTYWVAIHRHHHAFSDKEGDLHSPVPLANGTKTAWQGFLRGHIGWVPRHAVPAPNRYARDLLKDKDVQAMDRLYWPAVVTGLLVPSLAGLAVHGSYDGALLGLYWGGVLRLVIGHNVIWSINSLCHCFGSRPHQLPDRSSNFRPLMLLSWGESWHNNHHAQPTSARFGLGCCQVDIGWYVIAALAAFGFVSVRRSDSELERRARLLHDR